MSTSLASQPIVNGNVSPIKVPSNAELLKESNWRFRRRWNSGDLNLPDGNCEYIIDPNINCELLELVLGMIFRTDSTVSDNPMCLNDSGSLTIDDCFFHWKIKLHTADGSLKTASNVCPSRIPRTLSLYGETVDQRQTMNGI